eukprot:tig00021374_g21121.t1
MKASAAILLLLAFAGLAAAARYEFQGAPAAIANFGGAVALLTSPPRRRVPVRRWPAPAAPCAPSPANLGLRLFASAFLRHDRDFYDNPTCSVPSDPAAKAASKQHLWSFSYEWPMMEPGEGRDTWEYGITPADATDPLNVPGKKTIDDCNYNGKTKTPTLSGRCVSTLGAIGEANKNNFYRWGADKPSGHAQDKYSQWKHEPYIQVTCLDAKGNKMAVEDESTWATTSVTVSVFAGYDEKNKGLGTRKQSGNEYTSSEPKWAGKLDSAPDSWKGDGKGAKIGGSNAVGRYRCCAENNGKACTKYGWDFKRDQGGAVISEKDRCKTITNVPAFFPGVSPVTGIDYAVSGNTFTVAHNKCVPVPNSSTRWVIARCHMEWRENRA